VSRDQSWLIGPNSVSSALENDPTNLLEIWLDRERQDRRVQEIYQLAEDHDVPVRRVDKKEFRKKFGNQRHQGVAAHYQVPGMLDLAELLFQLEGDPGALVLVLDHIEDPHNFGACLRTAEAAGARAVIFPKDRAVGLTPSVRKAAAGSAERLPLVQVTNVNRSLKQLKDAGFWIVGAAGDAEKSVFEGDLTGRLALVMGGEAKGLHRMVREHCDFLFHIPIAAAVESLNVSVAAAIFLFEAVRQRKITK
jgi:23S rRNA (guanosine2251-2'-O)-methyltransferase